MDIQHSLIVGHLVGANVDYVIQRAGIHYPKEEQRIRNSQNSNAVLTQEMWDYCGSMDINNYY